VSGWRALQFGLGRRSLVSETQMRELSCRRVGDISRAVQTPRTGMSPSAGPASGSDESLIRNGRDIDPNQTEPSPGMEDTDHALFPRFSAELVSTALKDTPVVMVIRTY